MNCLNCQTFEIENYKKKKKKKDVYYPVIVLNMYVFNNFN